MPFKLNGIVFLAPYRFSRGLCKLPHQFWTRHNRRSLRGVVKWWYVANNDGALTRMTDCREVNDRQSGVNAARGSARSHWRGFVLHLWTTSLVADWPKAPNSVGRPRRWREEDAPRALNSAGSMNSHLAKTTSGRSLQIRLRGASRDGFSVHFDAPVKHARILAHVLLPIRIPLRIVRRATALGIDGGGNEV